MESKTETMNLLEAEFDRWHKLLAELDEPQINMPLTPSIFSIKDTMAHLRAWQQVSIARLEAALLNTLPIMPDWCAGLDPDAAEVDLLNAKIHDLNRQKPWATVHQEWSDGFLKLLNLAQQTSENELLDKEKYAWLNGYALMDVLHGSLEHHLDHYEPLCNWLEQRGIKPTPVSVD